MGLLVFSLIGQAILVLFNILTFALFAFVNYFANQKNKYFFQSFLGNRTTDDISDMFYIGLTPARWTCYIWYVVYAGQALWMTYSVALLFTKLSATIKPLVLLLFTSSSILNISWCVLWSRLMIRAGCVVIFAGVFLTAIALILIYVTFNQLYDAEEHSEVDFWAFQLLVFNSIASYIVWMMYTSLLCLATVMSHAQGITEVASSSVILIILFVLIFVWFILENSIFLWSTRYTFSIYPTIIATLLGSVLGKNWNPASRNSIILVALLCTVSLLFVLRIIRVVFRLKRARKTYAITIPPNNLHSEFKLEFMMTRF